EVQTYDNPAAIPATGRGSWGRPRGWWRALRAEPASGPGIRPEPCEYPKVRHHVARFGPIRCQQYWTVPASGDQGQHNVRRADNGHVCARSGAVWREDATGSPKRRTFLGLLRPGNRRSEASGWGKRW